ncbi:RICIN domain-containing protein [Phytohabitans rumicis]|uniref:Ricin B lectin domain-containing protein n=1 Tax=Phytohabitans rumicis TaxID=1076125 RepID=A0A6V8LKQ0_9ACTN|nr:RICIN domain-containing protein [Phytohabitans rumicis]GFJ95458.1 hypothetical protein Prum_091000 [Phytohabitans rumicis]
MKSASRRRWTALGVLGFALSTAVAVAVPDAPAFAAPCTQYVCPDDPDPEPAPPRPHRPGNTPLRLAAMGDSFASGDGAANHDPGAPLWQDDTCHRSSRSGINRAFTALYNTNPFAEAVRIVNVTCSGAKLSGGGLLGPQTADGQSLSQLDQLNAAYGTATLDALVIGAGINDLGFENLITSCATPLAFECHEHLGAQFDADLAELPGKYDELITAIQGDLGGNNRRFTPAVRDVYLLTYPDPTTDDGGARCANRPTFDFFGNISRGEAEWMSTSALPRLNQTIQEAVARANNTLAFRPNWYVIEAPSFIGHGWCASDGQRWMNTVGDSMVSQLDTSGAMHPDNVGHQALGDVIYSRLRYLNDNRVRHGDVFYLTAAHSAKVASTPGQSTVDGAYVVQAPRDPEGWARWRAEDTGFGGFQLRLGGSQKCVDIEGGTSAGAGAKLVQRECVGSTTQRWYFLPTGDGMFQIRSAHSGQCVDVWGGSVADGASLVQWYCHNWWNQRWTTPVW